jgi:hypothetical protein
MKTTFRKTTAKNYGRNQTNRKLKTILLRVVPIVWQRIAGFVRKRPAGDLWWSWPMRVNERQQLPYLAHVASALLLVSGATVAIAQEPRHPLPPPPKPQAQKPPAPPATPIGCGQFQDIIGGLEAKYSEQLAARGLQSDGLLLQVYASEDTGSWTALLVRPDGWTCIVAAGKHWQNLPVVDSAGRRA